jgi:oligoribonuclease
MTADASHLIWIDLERTGRDPQNDEIIEIATIVTDARLEILAEGPMIAIHQPQQKLDAMDEWNQRQHSTSGLIKRVQESDYDEARAEAETLNFLKQYLPSGASPMCGNSICQDRRFLARTMPELEAFFHYRNLDVSTLKELMARWAPSLSGGFSKQGKHLALDDIRDSINELRYYRDNFLRLP